MNKGDMPPPFIQVLSPYQQKIYEIKWKKALRYQKKEIFLEKHVNLTEEDFKKYPIKRKSKTTKDKVIHIEYPPNGVIDMTKKEMKEYRGHGKLREYKILTYTRNKLYRTSFTIEARGRKHAVVKLYLKLKSRRCIIKIECVRRSL